MKKTSIMIIICLIFTNIIFNYSEIVSYADNEVELDILCPEAHNAYLEETLSDSTDYSSGLTSYDNFMTAYFDNLTYNIGVNYKGSCGYVAIAMLLSYYDTYLNDSIIPEQYDIASIGTSSNTISRRNSPGVLRDTVININDTNDDYLTKMSATDYFSYMNSMSNTSLHAKLITIGSSHGYYDFSVDDDEYPAGTVFLSRYNVLIDYLTEVAQISPSNYEISYINRESNPADSDLVKQFALQKIMDGKPVLLSIRGENGGHVVVAYDYEYNEATSSYSIYCHMGWGPNKTHVTIESEDFTIYRTALTIDFNLEHSHSNNYGVTTITSNVPSTEYYCYDYSHIITYKNLHSYTHHYERLSSTQHKSCCECGEYIVQTHDFSEYTNITDTHHTHSCVCGLTQQTEEHSHYRYEALDSSKHYVFCKCGYFCGLEAHIAPAGGHPNVKFCMMCGERVRGTTSNTASPNGVNPSIRYITEAGSYVDADGVIYLVESDIELFLAGELDVYALVEQSGDLVTQ